jgi:glutathione S-transferase
VLNWAQYGGVDLAEWPAVAAYYKRTALRPLVARALREEIALFGEQQARRQARAS